MAVTFAFLGMLLASLVVALIAAFQLGDFFTTGDEFVLVIAALAIFCTASMAVFAIASAKARRAQTLNWTAFGLALASFIPVLLPQLVDAIASRSTNPFTVGVEHTYITFELVVPALLAVLVQWGLARRRWLRAQGDEDFTLWPWVTTTVAGLVLLNPYGLAVLSTTLERSGSDMLWQFFATVAAICAAVLVVMASMECYIRLRMLRRRLRASTA